MSSLTALDDISVTTLKGAGKQSAERLEKLGIRSAQDLLFHLPIRYEDRTRICPLGNLSPGLHVLVEGRIEQTRVIVRHRSSLICRISDGTGFLSLRFFHFTSAQQTMLPQGALLRCYGEVRYGFLELEMVHPEYKRISDDEQGQIKAVYTPVYPLTQGLRQRTLRRFVEQAVDLLQIQQTKNGNLTDWIPDSILKSLKFPGLKDALIGVHSPSAGSDIELLENGLHPGQRRLAFEELLAHYLSLSQRRQTLKIKTAAVFRKKADVLSGFLAELPFVLTAAQKRVISEIEEDLANAKPMLRLLQGDVGSGKTVVAAYAALLAVSSQYQAAMMVPTELLAEQHFFNFTQWLGPLHIQIILLTGKDKGKARKEKLEPIRQGSAGIVIGTHALFQEDVEFSKLGLVVVDEQHRFGVHQRFAFRQKGAHSTFFPHQLVMTATPIPRTLAMVRFADLDVSVIDERPPGRTPVKTSVMAASKRTELIARIVDWVKSGRQVYWVCTLIEESEDLEVEAAENTLDLLRNSLRGITVALIHGRMKPLEKEQTMNSFKAGKVDMLVATTVIEVGVDIPNAGLMVIENAERLGLFQLHQLRGRVGRGLDESYCVLMYRPPLSRNARERLSIIRDTSDGFKIAEKDLELRGPGEVMGTRQTGQLQFRVANLVRDKDLILDVRKAADIVLQDYPDHVQPLIHRWLNRSSHYVEV